MGVLGEHSIHVGRDYKVFFTNEPNKTFQYIIWDTNKKEINISINGKELQKPKEWEIYDSLIPTENIKSIIINGVDYIDIYNKIYNNKLVGEDIVDPNAPLLSNI